VIEGLRFQFTSEEIATKYREIADKEQGQIDSLAKKLSEVERMSPESLEEKFEEARELGLHGEFGVGGCGQIEGAAIKAVTIKSLKHQIEARREQVDAMRLLADHVVKDEVFRLSANELDFLAYALNGQLRALVQHGERGPLYGISPDMIGSDD
jgi:hypothetical protein